MSMVYEILEYDKQYNCHVVRDAMGMRRFVDIMVNGDFPAGTEPESLVGQKVECDYEHPFIAIAMNVRVIPKKGGEG